MNDYLLTVWNALQGGLFALAILTVLDFILGVIVALVKKEFTWGKLDHYLTTDLLPILGWIVVVLITKLPSALLPSGVTIPVVSEVVYATVFLSILASILESLAKAGVLTAAFQSIGISDKTIQG